VRYSHNHQPLAVETVVVSAQHDESYLGETLAGSSRLGDEIAARVIQPALGRWWDDDIRLFVNPTGAFVQGGPQADTGLTGRKIIVDTYGGAARHGSGAFSGKDPTKVDRSGAYAARWVAKHVVAARLARRCELQVAYAIGVARPISMNVNTFGTSTLGDAQLLNAIAQVFDLRPAAIIDQLQLRRPIYRPTAAYGHFGRPDLDLPWERTDRLTQLLSACG
jgi:S-adenosylmethionine synthetase